MNALSLTIANHKLPVLPGLGRDWHIVGQINACQSPTADDIGPKMPQFITRFEAQHAGFAAAYADFASLAYYVDVEMMPEQWSRNWPAVVEFLQRVRARERGVWGFFGGPFFNWAQTYPALATRITAEVAGLVFPGHIGQADMDKDVAVHLARVDRHAVLHSNSSISLMLHYQERDTDKDGEPDMSGPLPPLVLARAVRLYQEAGLPVTLCYPHATMTEWSPRDGRCVVADLGLEVRPERMPGDKAVGVVLEANGDIDLLVRANISLHDALLVAREEARDANARATAASLLADRERERADEAEALADHRAGVLSEISATALAAVGKVVVP